MKPLLLDDNDVQRLLSPTECVAVIEAFFEDHARNDTAGVPRISVPLQKGNVTLTIGGTGNKAGFRAYLRGGFDLDDQLVAVWDTRNGKLRGLITGYLLGAMRTGAIGGVAVKYLAPPNARVMGLVGTGKQAFTQLSSILAVCPTIKEIRVYSRTPENRDSFCTDTQQLYQALDIYPVDSAELAVRDADVVVGATNSNKPVIFGEWVKAGAHITTIGPKGITQREVDTEVINRADFIVTDSLAQAQSFEYGFLMDDSNKPIYELSEVVSGAAKRPSPDAITLFISTGLAGTEVTLGAHLIKKVYDVDFDAEETLLLG